jgi:hypothetical protein
MCDCHIRLSMYCEWNGTVIEYDSHRENTKIPARESDQPVLSNNDVSTFVIDGKIWCSLILRIIEFRSQSTTRYLPVQERRRRLMMTTTTMSQNQPTTTATPAAQQQRNQIQQALLLLFEPNRCTSRYRARDDANSTIIFSHHERSLNWRNSKPTHNNNNNNNSSSNRNQQ